MENEEEIIIKCFTQSPNVLLYGLPQLPIQDKWVLITLMGLCWDRSQSGKTLKELEGPYKLSLREISHLTGADYTVLRNKQGKNPREGVLDRLERFGYLTVCEGRPIEEYTGDLGREQTYIYIRLRRIWEENMLFAEEWRVPANRLTNPNLVVFTVDHANSNVGVANNDVDTANSSVGNVNDTVGTVSTNYVLRQNNTKKTREEREKTWASLDATPSPFFEEALSYIKKRECVTYAQLEHFLKRFMNVRGEKELLLSSKNAVGWSGISQEFKMLIFELLASGKVKNHFGTEQMYAKGRRPRLPVATESVAHEEEQWHPMCLKYEEEPEQ